CRRRGVTLRIVAGDPLTDAQVEQLRVDGTQRVPGVLLVRPRVEPLLRCLAEVEGDVVLPRRQPDDRVAAVGPGRGPLEVRGDADPLERSAGTVGHDTADRRCDL